MLVFSYLTFGLVKGGEHRSSPAEEVEDGGEGAVKSRPSNVVLGPGGEILHDKYGFFLTDTLHRVLGKSPEEVEQRNAKERVRADKWLRMMKKWDFVCKYRSSKLKRRIRKGIPNTVRGWAWLKISEAKKIEEKYPDLSQLNLDSIPAKVKEDIEKDVDRTFPKHLQFSDSDGPGQASLRRLLIWYAAIDSEVGYCQGMGFIAGLLLTYMEEQDAFYCFAAALLNPKPTPLREIYLPDLGDAKKKLFVFGELGSLHLGALWVHLVDQKMHPTMYATEWLMTMFCRGFSFDLVTRVWDVYLAEGFKIVYRVALALLKTFESELLKAEFEDIMTIINSIAEQVDSEEIMNLAWRIPLKTEQIVKYERAYALRDGNDRVHL